MNLIHLLYKQYIAISWRLFFVLWSISLLALTSFAQHAPEAELAATRCRSLIDNYYALLGNIGSQSNTLDEKSLMINSGIKEYLFGEGVRVYNDLYTGGVRDYAIRDYLGTIMSTYPRSEGVKFKHTIKEIKGPYSGQGEFAFYLLRVERHLRGLNTSGIMQDATMTLDFYLRFDYSGGKWNYTPKIYDIRKAESGVEGRFTKWKEKDIPTVPAKSTPETPKETTTLPGLYEKIESKPIATNTSSLPAPIQKLINDMVFVQGGTFTMGCTSEQGSDCDSDERPTFSVTLSSYSMGKFEVTNSQYAAFLNAKGNQLEGGVTWINLDGKWEGEKCRIYRSGNSFVVQSGYENHPVIYVSWYGARAFCSWMEEITGKKYRLPTEAEWEYAARSRGKANKYAWGNGAPTRTKGGNIADETGKRTFSNWSIWEGYDDGYVYSAPVGSFGLNDAGLADMSGNVWEWCSDIFGAYSSSSKTNPPGSPTGTDRVIRGGSWNDIARGCRVSFRYGNSPDYRSNFIGFRLALTP